jgi:hypothetical protein
MSVTEIIEELPRLSHSERRTLCRKIIAMEAEQEEIVMCDDTARQGFATLDEMEAEDEKNA